ncbi:MAG: hypothetical protein GWN07_07275, partial [Actinobacteria bacterium]|nr:hypothetical protein [Actinomycetota bacterium]NIS36358.1 hypothetical protein [Actinomycetota bacterium]NIU70887.1 hypothetical protein [Actinomycetota bacterium]NIV90445.1 hypothetical protein [Actinomycetota bacterium]NIW32812.1 hypothetical protein [Actinomycetota bacterium]
GLIWSSLDAVGFTTVATSLETIAGPPTPTTPRRRQRADALVAMAEHALAGTGPRQAATTDTTTGDADTVPGAPPDGDTLATDTRDADGRPVPGQTRIPARPRARVTIVVDLSQATEDRFALLQRTTGLAAAPTLSARLTDTLAANAQLFVQLTDGRRPLAELAADDIPDAVR